MAEYIEREAAKMHFYDIDTDIKQSKAKIGFSLVQVHEALDDISAADVAPVVHAHWENITRDIIDQGARRGTCSKCQSRTLMPPVGFENFCPVCGAKMDENQGEAR